MDLRLPGMSGLEAARRVRLLEGGEEVKIVALTAAFSSERDEVLASGLDDFLRKPYRRREIFDCMARLLGVRYTCARRTATFAEEQGLPLHPEALAELSEELCEELEDALISLDMNGITLLIGALRDGTRWRGQRDLANKFPRANAILRALGAARPVWPRKERERRGISWLSTTTPIHFAC
jgi:CheY-like chemotaxis protein